MAGVGDVINFFRSKPLTPEEKAQKLAKENARKLKKADFLEKRIDRLYKTLEKSEARRQRNPMVKLAPSERPEKIERELKKIEPEYRRLRNELYNTSTRRLNEARRFDRAA